MANCTSCSAPLAANTNKCAYCNTRNDVDLKNNHSFSIVSKVSSALCPDCEHPLQTIDLKLENSFLIERCPDCFGLFFETGKVEALLEKSVDPVFDINLKELDNINLDRFSAENRTKYVKCPCCQAFMGRSAFGYRSGVIVDRCRNHGVWLSSGELMHLMEWKKAGGQLLHQQHTAEKLDIAERKLASKNFICKPEVVEDGFESGLVYAAISLLGKLFE